MNKLGYIKIPLCMKYMHKDLNKKNKRARQKVGKDIYNPYNWKICMFRR